MKKAPLMVMLLFVFAVGTFASEDNAFYGCVNKFTRGVVNIATGWVELPMQIAKGYRKGYNNGVDGKINLKNMPAASRSIGALNGLFRGIGHAAGRTVWGFVDCGTCWAKDRADNKNMLFLLDGEYAWSEGEPKYFCCPQAMNGVRKVGYRASRGLDDFVFAGAEIPCQTKVYWDRYRNGMVVLGALDGLWLCTSRLANGATELGLCWLPSPEERLQVPYNANHYYDFCERFDRNHPDLAK